VYGEARCDSHAVLARSVFLNVAGRVASLGLGFVASILLARLLGPSDRGLLGLMITASLLALAVVGVGIPLAVTYYASRKDADPRALLGNSLLWAAVTGAALVAGVWVFHEQVADLLGRGRGGEIWALAALLVPLTFLDWTTHNQLIGSLRFGLFNALVAVSKVVYVVAVVMLLAVWELGVTAGVVATGLSSLVMIFGSLPSILAAGAPRLDFGILRGLLGYGVRVQVGSLLQFANTRLDVVVLGFFKPLSEVGYYVVAQTIAELVTTLGLAFQTSVLPLVSHYEGDERQRATSVASTRNYGILAGLAVVANAAFGTLVILFGFGDEFHPALAPMLVLLPGIWFLGLGQVVQGDLGGRDRPGLSSILAGVAAVATLGLDLLLIPPYGVMGAAIASVVAYTIYGASSLVALHRVSGIPLAELIVPRRSDLARYREIVRSLPARLRERRSG
jgi:O-antigen/teichoic acid export membrane protein